MGRQRPAPEAVFIFGHPLFRLPLHALIAFASKHVVHLVQTIVAEAEVGYMLTPRIQCLRSTLPAQMTPILPMNRYGVSAALLR